jgi:cytochrome c oxidase subunit 1
MANRVESVNSGTEESTDLGVREIVSAMGAGLVGTAAMAPVLAVAFVLDFVETAAFEGLATIVGLGPSLPIGLFIFVGGGMTTLPLLYVSLAVFLPGGSARGKGVVFASIVWTGWSFAFFTGQTGLALASYLLLGLLAHVVYGATLGTIYGRVASLPEYRV